MSLPRELQELQHRVEQTARRYGLTFFQTIFEVVDYAQMSQLAAYTGFPVRYPHWRFGMEFEQLAKSYTYGLHKIYEMVINNDPTYAYLLEGNTLLDQKLVMAHVYGHADFFKNNVFFDHTNRKMVDTMANHATRVRRYMDRLGVERVEQFLDHCLTVEELIDAQAAFREPYDGGRDLVEDEEPVVVRPLPAKDYMQRYINPPERIEEERTRLEHERDKRRRFPPAPRRDVLGFVLAHSPLETWERDILGIVRDESYYFLPQRQTKIMNEGWASYWHTTMLTEGLLDPGEVVDYADQHSGTTATSPGRLNPYKLGLELFRDIKYRWDTGRFGREWDGCDDMAERALWDRDTGRGTEKIYEVRRLYNDLTFIDEFLTEDFARQQKLFVFAKDRRRDAYVITSREFDEVKRALLFQLTNFGTPIIEVVDGNFANRGELLLVHRHEGVELKLDWAREVLAALALLWHRPVHVETIVGGRPKRLGHDGTNPTEADVGATTEASR
ncbi:MAG: SpoVR family protein [Acidobacteria bacterium]|nr:SpoVR family protein [Acidobacteriota bacterium]